MKKLSSNSSQSLVFYSAVTQFDNLGDLLINRILIAELRKYARLVVNVNGVPEWYKEELGLLPGEIVEESRIKFRTRIILAGIKRLSGLKKNTFAIINPGHSYGDMKMLGGSFFRILINSTLIYLSGVRRCRFGCSIGPFWGGRESLERLQAKLMYFNSVRDSISKNYAESIGIQNTVYFPDLAWLMETEYTQKRPSIESREFVIFSFRDLTPGFLNKHLNSQEYQRILLSKLDKIVDYVSINLSKKILICYQVDRDKSMSDFLYDRYKNICKIDFLDSRVTSRDMEKVYSSSCLVFSNRLHVLMFSMAFGALPIAVIDSEKHTKISGVFADSGMKPLLLDIHDEGISIEKKLDDLVQKEIPLLNIRIAESYRRNSIIARALVQKTILGST
ncbi:MAG: polysaccharide pyruvyl transferase family protein [Cyanobacteriota bacterium]